METNATGSAHRPVTPDAGPTPAKGWKAELELIFERTHSRTTLAHRRNHGPLVVQRPFYPDRDPNAPCQVIVVHPPGGVVGGDRLHLRATAQKNAAALLATPGALKFYRTNGAEAVARNTLSVSSGGSLEWFPQETIVYDDSFARLETRVDLEVGARFIGWEVVGLGLPASGRPFRKGSVHSRFEIWRTGSPLWLDRVRYRGGDPMLEAAWGLAGYTAVGALVATGATDDLVEKTRALVARSGSVECIGITRVSDLIVCRALAHQTREILDLFASLWSGLRRDILGATTTRPGIWST